MSLGVLLAMKIGFEATFPMSPNPTPLPPNNRTNQSPTPLLPPFPITSNRRLEPIELQALKLCTSPDPLPRPT